MKCPYGSDVIVVNVSQRQQRNIQYSPLYTKVHYSAPQSLQRKPPSFSMPSFTPGALGAHPSPPLLLPDLPFRTHASRYRAKSAIFFYGRKVKAKVQDIFLPYWHFQPWALSLNLWPCMTNWPSTMYWEAGSSSFCYECRLDLASMPSWETGSKVAKRKKRQFNIVFVFLVLLTICSPS